MHGEITEIQLRLYVIQRPPRHVTRLPLVPGVRANGGISAVDGILSAVLHRAHEAPAAAHDEPSIPSLRQQQFKSDVPPDNALCLDIRRRARIFLEIGRDSRGRLQNNVG